MTKTVAVLEGELITKGVAVCVASVTGIDASVGELPHPISNTTNVATKINLRIYYLAPGGWLNCRYHLPADVSVTVVKGVTTVTQV